MFDVEKLDESLNLVYVEFEDYENSAKQTTDWILDNLDTEESYLLKKKFLISRDTSHSTERGVNGFSFQIGEICTLSGDTYYKLDKKVLRIRFDVFIQKDCAIDVSWFITPQHSSVFGLINSLGMSEPLIIGGKAVNAIAEADFVAVLKAFPNQTEIKKYVQKRCYLVLSKFFALKNNYEQKYEEYLQEHEQNLKAQNSTDFKDIDVYRLNALKHKLKEMLLQPENSEKSYQDCILCFIQVLYPKYVYVNTNVNVKSVFGKNKFLDILLADYNGFIDIIEIKRPTLELLRKNQYRNNYIPSMELEGALHQAEKYLYHLMKNSVKNEEMLNKELSVPNGLELKIVNPKAFIIMGRSDKFNIGQKEDYEIIKRKYKNVTEILSYDDLLQRIEVTLKFLEKGT